MENTRNDEKAEVWCDFESKKLLHTIQLLVYDWLGGDIMSDWINKFYSEAKHYNFDNRTQNILGVKQTIEGKINTICYPLIQLQGTGYKANGNLIFLGELELEFSIEFQTPGSKIEELLIFKKRVSHSKTYRIVLGEKCFIEMQGYGTLDFNETNIDLLVKELISDAFK